MAVTEPHLRSKKCCKCTRLYDFNYFSFILKKRDLQRAHNGVWPWVFVRTCFPPFLIPMILHHLHKFPSHHKCKMGVKWKTCPRSRVNTQAVSSHWAPAVPACLPYSNQLTQIYPAHPCTKLRSVWLQYEHTLRDTRPTTQSICILPVKCYQL